MEIVMNREIMLAVGFSKELALIDEGKCPRCSSEIDHNFTDELSQKEFKKSGMCQGCQDSFFGPPSPAPISFISNPTVGHVLAHAIELKRNKKG
tara:strand:+ start:45 stop:326 length:282 start_codon:yes stop_codon:yes gene_type:complete